MTEEKKDLQEQKQLPVTGSERFLNTVIQQFSAETSNPLAMSEYQKSLAQHMFLKLDSVLKDAEAKRQSKNEDYKAPFTWENINMRKLALDAVHTVQLGLDALIPNHIHPITYFNKKENKYDVDLRPGYIGKAYYRHEASLYELKNVIYELVYSTDFFKAVKGTIDNPEDAYIFEIKEPFNRGEIVGGFGYIQYKGEKKSELVLVSREMIDKSRAAAQSDTFWENHFEEMAFKTLVHRTTEKIQIDPKKINAAFLSMENKEDPDFQIKAAEPIEDEITENANKQTIELVNKNQIPESADKRPIVVQEIIEGDESLPEEPPTQEKKRGF